MSNEDDIKILRALFPKVRFAREGKDEYGCILSGKPYRTHSIDAIAIPNFTAPAHFVDLLHFHERGGRHPEVASLRDIPGKWCATLWIADGEFLSEHGRTPMVAMKNATLRWLERADPRPSSAPGAKGERGAK